MQRDSQKAAVAEVRPRLTLEHRMQLLAHLLRLPALFAQARLVLKSEMFCEPDEPHLRILWRVATKVANDLGPARLFVNSGQTWNLLSAECQAYAATHKSEIAPMFLERLLGPSPEGMLAWAFSLLPEGELNESWGRDLLVQFLDERWVQDPLRRAMDDAGSQAIANLDVVLADTKERRAALQSLSGSESLEVAPAGWEPRPLIKSPTLVSFVDDALMGGDCPGETYGVLGAMKAGKTTLAIQLLTGSAKQEMVKLREAAGRGEEYSPNYGYLFHYEAGADEIRNRIVVHACEISRKTVEDWGRLPLSTAGHLKPYETRYFEKSIRALAMGELYPGEYERYHGRADLLKMMRLFDMSGPRHSPKDGSGGVAEIAAKLEGEARRGRKIGRVIIDYAGQCVRRHVLENRFDDSMYYRLLSSFGYDCLRMIATPFDCPVWIMHQLSGQSNKRTSATKQHHADAAGSASFAENLWFCFQLGVPAQPYHGMWFSTGVARRAAVGEPVIVRLDGEMGTIRKAPELVATDDGRIVLHSDMRNVNRPRPQAVNMSEAPTDEYGA